jgi:hypothetical protein
MAQKFRKGDKVEWNTSQGTTRGTVEKRQTSETRVKGHRVAASDDNPEYIVRSETSGKKAAHKPEALRKEA